MPTRCPIKRLRYSVAFLTVVSAALAACTLTGSTARETLNVRAVAPARLAVPIVIDKVVASRDAPGLIAAGTMRVGAFNLDDLANIRGTLADTLRASASAAPAEIDDRLRLSVVIRRYLVAHSNNAAGALVAVDWCAARGGGDAVYRELFYAAGEGAWVTSLGEVKNRAQRALVQRIAESALRLAEIGGGAPAVPVRVEGTYETVEAAAATLPARLKSVALGGPELIFVALAAIQNMATPVTGVPWGQGRVEGSISCQQLQDSPGAVPGERPVIASPAEPLPIAAPAPAADSPLIPRAKPVPSDPARAGAGAADIYCRPSLSYAGGCGSDPNAE